MLDRLEKPMDYDTAMANEQDEPIKIEQAIEFFVNFIKVDQLGRIANTLVAISDTSTDGVEDKRCVKLAELFSIQL
jgi:RNA-dependent RNA polymerase